MEFNPKVSQDPKYGPRFAAPAYGGPPPYARGEPKTEFDIHLVALGTDTMAAMKILRDDGGFPLREAKRMVDDVKDGKPQLVKKDVSRAEAEDIRRKFEAAGAQIRVS